MIITRKYTPKHFSNYSSHCVKDDSYAASHWMELHKHDSIYNEKVWSLVPTAVHDKEARLVVWESCFKVIKPVVGVPITFNHKCLHGLLPASIAGYIEGRKRKTKAYLEWEKYHTHLCIEQKKVWDIPVMEWKFI